MFKDLIRIMPRRVLSVGAVPCITLFFFCAMLLACSEKKLAMDTLSTQAPYSVEGLEREGLNREIKEALRRVPRHQFVPKELTELAYSDRALPIAHQQTISQPYIVALMTQAAEIVRGSKVLEIGTGSGYQAAVLSELGARVFSVEIIPELAEEARQRLLRLGYNDIAIRVGDGWQGWEEFGPYDAIIVTAAAPSFPPSLLQQLAERGRLVMPIEGEEVGIETLVSVQKVGNNLVSSSFGLARFVPLTGQGRKGAKGISERELKVPGALESFIQQQTNPSSSSAAKPPVSVPKNSEKEAKDD